MSLCCLGRWSRSSFRLKSPNIHSTLQEYLSLIQTGDLFAALLIGHIGNDVSCHNIVSSCEKSICVMQSVLKNTIAAERKELDIVGSLNDILNTNVTIRATLI
jgi:pyridoxal/pyridoxine/pyridoxamine kinase